MPWSVGPPPCEGRPGAERDQGLALWGVVFRFIQLSLGNLAFLWELGFPACKMGMSPTPVLGDSVRLGPAATEYFALSLRVTIGGITTISNHMMLLFAHLQKRKGLLVRKSSKSETSREGAFE